MIAIVDYGVGNLFSLTCSLEKIGAEARLTADPEEIRQAERIILPGVGAFGDAAEKLRAAGLDKVLREEAAKGKPILGICLGMQLLFERSMEYGEHPGLGLIPGTVRSLSEIVPESYKIPHMGWNALHFPGSRHPLFRDLKEGDFVYFVHSFHAAEAGDAVIATSEYGGTVTAAAAKGCVMGCQFHPEKSGDVGLRILKAFAEENFSC